MTYWKARNNIIMSIILKYTGVLFAAMLIIALVVVFTGSGNSKIEEKEKQQTQNAAELSGEQYRISFSFEGNRNQIIDLIKGKAKFKLIYEENSKIYAVLMHTDGTQLALLANENGPFKREQVIEIPETGAYILDVRTTGEWSLSRE